ncbi:uncharacterized protein LOC117647903 [Thrips palmi]|uniref:Uncharacterized protein LOC117647903 n=1 Tax=Thrips palmi TaxID=161013 RepID=A0A6P8ZQF6_THRPL|nr:uncharacterized protein LOC117647903 [Thrips palmi]
MADVAAVVHAFKVLTCPDRTVRMLAEASLKQCVQYRVGRMPEHIDLAAFLSGAKMRENHEHASIWTAARNATRRLSNKIHGLCWEWSPTLQRLTVCVPFSGRQPEVAKVDVESRRLLHSKLRQCVQHHHHRRLLAKPDQGKVYDCASLDASSNHFVAYGRHTRFADWRFIFRARLGVLPLRGCIRGVKDLDRKCRYCHQWDETTAHVLCHCQRLSQGWRNRHSTVVQHLVDAMPEHRRQHLRLERTVVGSGSNLKPDIVVRDTVHNVATIIDVACPFENRRTALATTREHKINKYKALETYLEGQGFTVILDAVVVGALGSWDPRNQRALAALGVKETNTLKQKIVSDVIKWSRDIYVEHVSGVRQYTENVQPHIPRTPQQPTNT